MLLQTKTINFLHTSFWLVFKTIKAIIVSVSLIEGGFVKKSFYIGLISTTILFSQDNGSFGQGYAIGTTPLKMGGYISTEASKSKFSDSYGLEDVAIMAYGDLSSKLSVMVEVEAAGFYTKSFGQNKKETFNTDFAIERAYVDYHLGDETKIRLGKYNTPAGYWNAMPINVLRQTTSSPWLVQNVFPKFVTGVMLDTLLPWDEESWEMRLFAQNTPDIDKRYINIQTDKFIGGEVRKLFSQNLSMGLAGGEFRNGLDPNEKYRYHTLSAKYKTSNYELLAEWAKSFDSYKTQSNTNGHKDASYIQGSYKVFGHNTIVLRNEFYHDTHTNDKGAINTIGWNYKPHPAVSVKGEYQFHTTTNKDQALFSLSVLF